MKIQCSYQKATGLIRRLGWKCHLPEEGFPYYIKGNPRRKGLTAQEKKGYWIGREGKRYWYCPIG